MSRVGKRVGFVAAGLVVVIAVVAIVGLAVDDAHQRRQVDQLHAHQAELARAAAATTSELTAVRQQLDQNKKDLDAAKAAVAQQTSQLDELKRCLAGVSAFFDKVSAGDQAGAVNAINGVQAQCDAADKLIGQ